MENLNINTGWDSFYHKSYPQNAANQATLAQTNAPGLPVTRNQNSQTLLIVGGAILLIVVAGVVYYNYSVYSVKKRETDYQSMD
jgi:hypothetical protein